ncbi:peroxiredoxin-like family protein [Ramlibacter sp.]|uniref:peroxiredoxin-like family protein n=1 Tax=Ramlibacter sp. TaxID=1917967 RepID=UPI0017C91FDD|nr:peroxiredoxin-like family protein [Ramlibacter sp.]MBA2675076.1 AhpC/TSA family protein [Ramlibacter sp.]
MPIPRQPAPALQVPLLSGGEFRLADETPERFTLVCFYRGLHCPICASYLKELEKQVPAFAERGVSVVTISGDTEERARAMAGKVGAERLRIGWGLPLEVARQWSLSISASRGKTSLGIEEPALFSEPGVFLLRPDQSVYWFSVQSMPFVRPNFAEIVQALDFVIKNDYPARGEYTGPLR